MFSNNLTIAVIILIYLILLYIIILLILKLRTKIKIKNIIKNINNDINNNTNNNTSNNNNKINKIKLTFKKSFIDGQILYINLFCDDKLLLKEVTDLINKNQVINLKSSLNNFSHSHPHIHTY